MQNIGHLAYKVKFDARELTHGTMSSRKQLAEYKKILADSQTPLERYAHGLENLRVMTAKFPELVKHQARVQRISKSSIWNQRPLFADCRRLNVQG